MIKSINLLMTQMIIKFKAYQVSFKNNKMFKNQVKIGATKYKSFKLQKMSNKESHKICLINSTLKKITTKKMISLLSISKKTFFSKKVTMPFSAKKNKKLLMKKSYNN